ncbi:TPM domain-containing protein [Sphingomonas sp.]|uniref:TPM domain-containing protein n=1 Tax=Sphingomonas sp. TaxID=28214 RepID=UPI003B3A0F43
MRLQPDDSAKVAAAIRAAEARTDGEISAIVSNASDSYGDIVLQWSALAALFPLTIAAAWPPLLLKALAPLTGWEAPSVRIQLSLLTIVCVLMFVIGRFVIGRPAVRMAVTPRAIKERRVRARAIMLFRAGTEQRTLSKTGVLLYLSLAEHRAEIVADAAIHARAPQEAWGEAMAALVEAMRDGRPGDGMAAAVERIGAVLATHFPFSGTDPNELPDRLIQL